MAKFDLEERTAKFGGVIIDFAKRIPTNPVTVSLISQLVRAATSIGANYCEANNASSKKDFVNKIFICRKESRETKYWLQMVAKAVTALKEDADKHAEEAHQLNLIFAAISNKCKKPSEN